MKTKFNKTQRAAIYRKIAEDIAKDINNGYWALCMELGDEFSLGYFRTEDEEIYKAFPEVFKLLSPEYFKDNAYWFDYFEGNIKNNNNRILILLFAEQLILNPIYPDEKTNRRKKKDCLKQVI